MLDRANGRQQFGQVTQAEFDTLVWRAVMANRAALGTVQQPAPALTATPAPEQPRQQVRFCRQCGKPFALGGLLEIGTTLCAACKDVVLQRPREGAATGGLAFQAPVRRVPDPPSGCDHR